jgi:hypothetical protein
LPPPSFCTPTSHRVLPRTNLCACAPQRPHPPNTLRDARLPHASTVWRGPNQSAEIFRARALMNKNAPAHTVSQLNATATIIGLGWYRCPFTEQTRCQWSLSVAALATNKRARSPHRSGVGAARTRSSCDQRRAAGREMDGRREISPGRDFFSILIILINI